ncbi:hypothetical protein EPA93_11310 [Ktedonosporobacter rubrisoli]|uniref:Uncharacterized protein n=1 Tax=Ktedonosporobacter rubrisoli TaxID=2509675 RepID=A0A4P6JP75_KTERU|nr:hypothetical protein [Ktedonosporobacter rubrisoli]QBD76556.1 hypothetical protein EPA93_11310 [Ktedonosporobacter rubrisoli]
MSLDTSTLKIEYQDTELAFYTMEWAEENKHIERVKNPRLIETGYQSPQPSCGRSDLMSGCSF